MYFKYLFVSMYFFGCLMGWIEFNLWQQVVFLDNSEPNFGDLILNPHGMRYLVVSPFFAISDLFHVSYDWVFSVFVPLLIWVSVSYATKTIEVISVRLSVRDKSFFFTCMLVFYILLSLLMNGRIIFAFLGGAILLFSLVSWDSKYFISLITLVMLSLFLCSVSSGTFAVASVVFFGFLLYRFLTAFCRKDVACLRSFFLILMAVTVFYFLKPLVIKNMNYFGGGWGSFLNMLSHGFGKYFYLFNIDVLVFSLLIVVVFMLFLVFLIPYYKRVFLPVYFIGVSIAGGAFGITTATMAIPPLLVVMCVVLIKMSRFSRYSSLIKSLK